MILLQIEAMRKDGKFLARDGSSVPEGQAIVTSNLAEAYEILQVCLLQLVGLLCIVLIQVRCPATERRDGSRRVIEATFRRPQELVVYAASPSSF